MKKLFVFAASVAAIAAVSCNKSEADLASVNNEPVRKITAVIENATKTAYVESGSTATFSWKAGDQIKLLVYSNSDATKAANFYRFNADSDGASSDFTLSGTSNWSAYRTIGYALYSSELVPGGTDGAYTVTLPDTYSVTGSDFSTVKIPMIGKETSTDVYSFKTAVGVLKLTLTNVPVAARKLVLKTSDAVAGTYPLDYENGLLMSAATSSTNIITINFSQQPAGSTVDVYIPVPVGSISAGATIEIQQTDGTVIKATGATVKAIPVERNKILPIGSISVEDWVSLGTGKFIDNHAFYQAGWSSSTIDASTYLNVEIQQHATETNRYRLVHPYQALFDTYGTTPLEGATGPNEYLTFTVRNDISEGVVLNDSYRTGFQNYEQKYELWHDNPYWGGENYFNNRIINYDGSGNPANIQLAPHYYGYYDDSCAENPKIEIVFPGSSPMLVFNYAGNTTASYADGNISVTLGANATGVKAVAAAYLSEGVEAILAGDSSVLSFDATGSQPVSLADGTYRLIYKVETDGHGYTFKDGGAFLVSNKTEIPLTASMVSVSIDAGNKDGSAHYDGDGASALVDGDISTFWHTPWMDSSTLTYYQGYGYYTDITDPYLYDDLDFTYGAYIDIDLGSGKTVTDFEVRACLRNTSTDFPRHVIIYTSADTSVWKQVAEVANICSGINKGEWITPIECSGAAARYIRFSIIENTSGLDLRDPAAQGCTHLAEIKIFE